MAVIKDSFLQILRDLGVSNSEIDNINNKDDSPLCYFLGVLRTLPEGNQEEHSYSVLKRSIELVRRSGVAVSPTDYAILFYTSLLHDISKSGEKDVEIDICAALNEECKFFSHKNSDHGITSAHYLERKHRNKNICFYGLEDCHITQLLNIMAFHTTGDMHTCFVDSRELDRKELLLCLAFWIADVADGADYRVPATRMVDKKRQSPRTKARQMVKEVSIEKNYIVWWVDEHTEATRLASVIENQKLSKHRPLLQAFDLPSQIVCLKQGQEVPTEDACLQYCDITSSNLCLNAFRRVAPLVLSANTLPEIYEKIVEAFYQMTAKDTLSHSNYFGPVVLEVRNVENDEAEKTNIRSETGKDINTIKDYTQIWLNPNPGAEKEFYFGYTHGQRISRYLYPRFASDTTSAFQDWQGSINQFDHVATILKEEGLDARRCYMIIPHPLIDNPKSYYYHEEEVAPALIAVQFALEEGEEGIELSAFALLRGQELSLFFVVNYLEIKQLIIELIEQLSNDINGIRAGRIVMMTALAYFAPDTVLLDKPDICKKEIHEIESYGSEFNTPAIRRELISLLRNYAKDYIKIESHWCDFFAKALPKGKEYDGIREGASQLKKALDSLEKKRAEEGYSTTHPEIRENKTKAINDFIRIIGSFG